MGRTTRDPRTRPGDAARPPVRASTTYEYNLALSFAGEDRHLAHAIGMGLLQNGVKVFYDEFEEVNLWGKKLSEELAKRYSSASEFVLVLISKHYTVKDWTDFEFRIAHDEARRRTREFILPVRLDDTPLVGLRSDVAYVDLRKVGVEGVVERVVSKLGTVRGQQLAVQRPTSAASRRTFLVEEVFLLYRDGRLIFHRTITASEGDADPALVGA